MSYLKTQSAFNILFLYVYVCIFTHICVYTYVCMSYMYVCIYIWVNWKIKMLKIKACFKIGILGFSVFTVYVFINQEKKGVSPL